MDSLLEKEVRLETVMPLFKEYLAAGKTVKFSPRGVSMLPMLRQGTDSVVLAPAPTKLKRFDLPLYQRDNGQYVLHRIVKVGETYTCTGDNQFALETGVRHDQVIAVVTHFYRGDKMHSVGELSHHAYIVLWHYSRAVRHLWRRGIRWIRRHLS